MKTFPDKGISQINYNFLNLPQSIVQNSNSTYYTYRADGTKVSKAFTLNGATIDTDYLDGFVYTSTYTQQLEAALLADDLPTREAVSAGQEESMQLERKVVAVPNNPPSVAAAKPSFFPTAEGFYDYDNLKYIYQYKDHLGNVRLSYSKNATTGLIAIEDTNDYYPFGLSFINGGASNYSPSTTYKNYKYNGKELQETGMYDYGARMYMPDIGRWGVLDGKGELYLSKSPYSYANNTPVNAIDPDGNIVIFINGMHTGEGGSSRYWTDYNSPVGRMQVAGGSWMTMYKRFDMAVMRQLNDYNAIYRDGALGGAMNTALYAVEKGINPFASSVSDYTNNLSPTNRRNWGYAQGQRDAKTIIDNLARDTTSGEIVETIKIISHSMGGAYAKGYVRALKQYISTLPKEQQSQIKISFEADFAPFQPTKQQAVDGVNTFQFSHSKDRVAGNKEMDGAYNQDTSSDKGQGHSIFDFFEQVKNLSEGNYKVVNGKIVPAN